MGAMKELWLRLLDGMEDAGRSDHEAQGPLPSDDELRKKVRELADQLGVGGEFGVLLAADDELGELREAYDKGRRRKRIAAAVEAADLAFWAAIGAQFPEVESGDFPPDAGMRFGFTAAQHRAVATWLDVNSPPEGIAEGRLAGASIKLARQDAAAERIAAHIRESGIRPDVLAELVEAVAMEASNELARDHDYYPLGEQLVRGELTDWVYYRAGEVNRGGVDEQANHLVAHLGEAKARERVDAAKAASEWWWNQHRDQLGDWCPHSGQLVPPAPEGVDEENQCPAGCPASQPSQDINDRDEDEQ